MSDPAAAMSEAALETAVRAILRDLPGLLWYHTRDSRRSPHGFPDLVIAGPRSVLWRELKRQDGRLRPQQEWWLHALAEARQDAAVWRPSDLLSGNIGRELAACAYPQIRERVR
jgi:hypothetical protein